MDNHDMRDRRLNYDVATLDDGLTEAPWELFSHWLDEASAAQEEGEVYEANAMTVATVLARPDGTLWPDARVVLLKSWDERGLVFFTNYDSAKGHELTENPQACLLFHWPELQRQVRFNCRVERVDREESEEYFAMRPRGSQVAAWASRQSEPVGSRVELETEYQQAEGRYAGAGRVPCPPNWGGFRCIPERVEFWQGRPSRLHDRLVFTLDRDGWAQQRLCP